MLLSIILTILEKMGLALLGTFFQSTAKATQEAGIDASALDYLYQLVSSAEADQALVTGDAKFAWVESQAIGYFKSRGIDLAITLLESLIQLAVHNLHLTGNVQHQTIATVSAPAPKP